MEFLVTMTLAAADVPAEEREALQAAERGMAIDYYSRGVIVRMWRLPGRTATVSAWSAADATQLHELLTALPLSPWMTTDVVALAQHYLEQSTDTDQGRGR